MLIDNIHLPKIIDGLAKFDGRKKRYVIYPSVLDDSNPARKRELQLLVDLQTQWELLLKRHPGNVRFTQSFNKHYKQVLWPGSRTFLVIPSPVNFSDELWLPESQMLGQFQRDFINKLKPLSKEGFDKFQAIVQDKISQACKTTKTLKQAWQTIRQFIDYQNQRYMLAGHYYPKIIAPQPIKFNPLIIDKSWVKNGKALVKIIRAVEHDWEKTADYSQEKIIGWLIFSGIVYGGMNEIQMLQGWLTSLLAKEYQPFIKERIVVSPRHRALCKSALVTSAKKKVTSFITPSKSL